MESADNFKRKLREESDLPAGFGWEDMEAGIFDKMADLDTAPTPPERRFLAWKVLGGLLVLLLGIVGIWYGSNLTEKDLAQADITSLIETGIIANSTLETEQNVATNPTTQRPKINATAKNKTTTTPATPPVISTKKTTAATKNSAVNKLASSNLKKDNNFIKSKTQKTDNQTLSSNFITNKNSAPSINTITNAVNNSTTILKNEPVTTPNIATTKNQKTARATPPSITRPTDAAVTNSTGKGSRNMTDKNILNSQITHLKTLWQPLTFSRSEAIKSSPIFNPPNENDPHSTGRFSVALGGGINYRFANRSNDAVSKERTNFEREKVGLVTSLQLDYRWSENWSVNLGLQYQQHLNVLNFVEEREFKKLQQDVVLAIQVNSFQGDSLSIIGDTLVNARTTRTVRHYNQTTQWSIPVGINYILRQRNLEYQLGVGALFSINRPTEGRTITAGLITDYNAGQPLYKSGLTVAVQGAFGVNYYLTERHFIGTQITVTNSLTDWNIEAAATQRPLIFSGQFRVGMRF